ncbi:MAG: oxalyl-CoA decarboxylase [Thermoflexaceae bacterium]|nr:oxalyl-CoA decarboxylase [Thermoflexaceae bacterium]
MATIDGATIIARSLRQQGVEYMFGVVGVPVIPIAFAAQREGIKYFGFRNEQAASYAAGAAGYLTGRPGVCLAVSGPGMVHGIAGLANAWSNCWPMILIGGANDSYQNGRGAFQEAPQVEAARPFSKYVARPESTARLPFYIEQAVRSTIYGRPGAAYLDLPGDIIGAQVEEDLLRFPPPCPEPPRTFADPEAVQRALAALRSAARPLVIVGKGAAYARAESEVRAFIEAAQLPYLASPMGKGVLPDDHPLSVAPARSYALQNADLVLLLGARLNWIMHFGLPPRWAEGVRVIQADIAPEEIGTNVPTEVALVGDLRAVAGQLNGALQVSPWQYPAETTWWTGLRGKIEANRQATEAMLNDDTVPMGYYRVLREIRDLLPRDAVICSEGANTMDIGRTVLPNFLPRHRLDAGTFGTMGVGLGFAIAAAAVHPDKKVVAVEGDSAFGFSGMEVEVACRYGLPITFIIINNNGIGGGPGKLDPTRIPPTAYTPNARYERIIEAFGGKGYFVETPAGLGPALSEALSAPVPTIVNIMINPRSQRRPQEFAWHTR